MTMTKNTKIDIGPEFPINREVFHLLDISKTHREMLELQQIIEYYNRTHNKKKHFRIMAEVITED